MADITLRAQLRTVKGKKVGALRRAGIVPGNIYGRGLESLPVQVDIREFRHVLAAAGASTVVDLHVATTGGQEDGQTHPVLIEHLALHPATGKLLHIDFHQVDLNRPVRAAVPLVLVGDAPGAELGGVLMRALDTLEVEALPRDLPHEIAVDISVLVEIDSQITVAELPLPPGVTAVAEPEILVAKIVASKLEQEIEAEAAEAAEAAAEAEAAEEAEEAPAGQTAAEGEVQSEAQSEAQAEARSEGQSEAGA